MDKRKQIAQNIWRNKWLDAKKRVAQTREEYTIAFEQYYYNIGSKLPGRELYYKEKMRRTMNSYMRALQRVKDIESAMKEAEANDYE